MTEVVEQPTESVENLLEAHRVELTAYSYRMLGSAFEAEDAVQEALVRAWRSFDRFEGRSSLRSWLYRIATNVCLDLLSGRARRARPMDLGPAQSADSPLGAPLPEAAWLEPMPDHRVLPGRGDPAEVAELRETVRLAFVAALQLLPPRQRAVLILREVLQWPAAEVADLLEVSVASVNSALQRARATLAASDVSSSDVSAPQDQAQRALLERYVDAFERYDLDALTTLLHEEATWSMPPFAFWLRGPADITRFMVGTGSGCQGSRLVATEANGSPAFAHYKPDGSGAGYEAWSLQVLEISAGAIVGTTFFLDVAQVFPRFDLPLRLDS